MNPENVDAPLAQHFARMVRVRILSDARNDVRSRIESAGGRWTDWAEIAREALTAFLEWTRRGKSFLYHSTYSPFALAPTREQRHLHRHRPGRPGNRPTHGGSSDDLCTRFPVRNLGRVGPARAAVAIDRPRRIAKS